MKTTLELPEDLVRAIKLRADHQGRKLDEVIVELLVAGLPALTKPSSGNGAAVSRDLPRMKVRPVPPPALPPLSAQEWCDWIKGVDLQQDMERHEEALGRQHLDRADA
jgi:hypothetical protein